eukprot:CAMPEP_0204297420 /NCGR_PEP_ID=MMETSP0468-20130131/73161_1 /ASSEMBLY_ACC=CAM_ASM_000383 /TAXON_ID=2969 /ORGANISM="Oxyrrhis marina" /LENGTH=145 /DNA_ID=CAMNT_0051276203 /DNA_START=32 /DNA_END=469 /DNA_ORIENTATION=+
MTRAASPPSREGRPNGTKTDHHHQLHTPMLKAFVRGEGGAREGTYVYESGAPFQMPARQARSYWGSAPVLPSLTRGPCDAAQEVSSVMWVSPMPPLLATCTTAHTLCTSRILPAESSMNITSASLSFAGAMIRSVINALLGIVSA